MTRSTFTKFAKSCAAGLLGLALTAGVASSASAENIPVYNPTGGTRTPATGGYNYNGGGTLTNQSLPGFLNSMGAHPEVTQGENGEPSTFLPFETPKCKGKIYLNVSADRTKLWMVVGIGKLGRGAASPAVLQQLMQYNDTLGALLFSMDKDGFLSIKRPIDNIDVTPQRFQAEAGKLLDAIDSTNSFWMPLITAAAAEQQGGGVPAPAPAAE